MFQQPADRLFIGPKFTLGDTDIRRAPTLPCINYVKEIYGESFHRVCRWNYLAGVALEHNATKYVTRKH